MAPYYPKDSPETWPIGDVLPPQTPHGISVSLPTWDSVVQWMRREQCLLGIIKTGYPRFRIHRSIEKLQQAVLSRLKTTDAGCMIFASTACATRCREFMIKETSSDRIETVSFYLPSPLPVGVSWEDARWVQFGGVVFPIELQPKAMAYWTQSGDGISSRHAEYAMSALGYLIAVNEKCPSLCLDVTLHTSSCDFQPIESGKTAKTFLRSFIAERATSRVGLIAAHDVFLFSTGMSAIYSVSRALRSLNVEREDCVAIYGFPYAETVKAIEMTRWSTVILHGHGTTEELDQLEADLANGQRLTTLFCEFPSNPQLKSPDLRRLRRLADRYGFVIACDETIGTFVNVDLLPYVDVIMTSLTKSFSGASDVMGGSVIINPNSAHHDPIYAALASAWEDIMFPLDAITLARNCTDLVARVRKSSATAETLAHLLDAHPSVERVNYPSLVESRRLYEECRRPGGGYGFLISIVFRTPGAAVQFYDNLHVPKGPSLGANFTLAIPYAQIAHPWELEWAARYDVPAHLVRISVGLEEREELRRVVEAALACIV
ncbi:cystathionine beta-lyase [Aspergillus indologenus CBS 114.80]|uniref:Cystathionine beta-lyase n=1 Tax=Aspergillus indologenus CBS 114.80 TaxID=1450541 RepID=A0A2V5I4C5_9EURO|nr:cystathionine beta-lyase [Aspergillus indologenus CBS 114.80]